MILGVLIRVGDLPGHVTGFPTRMILISWSWFLISLLITLSMFTY